MTSFAGPETDPADVERYLGSSRAVVAVESGWLGALRSCRLHCYRLPAETFVCVDACAGSFVSREPVVPVGVEVIEDPLAAILERGVELRFLPSLWALRDGVVASSLMYPVIRLRNARPRPSA